VTGSAGGRIKVILGASGDDYVYFLDETYGDSAYDFQTSNWTTGEGSLPSGLAKQLNACTAKHRHITEVAHGPDGEWYVAGQKRDGSGAHAWWGGTEAADSIKEAFSEHRVRASFGGKNYHEKWVIVTGTNGYQTSGNVDPDLSARMQRNHKRRGTIDSVRLLPGGGYFIRDSEGSEWKGAGTHLSEELENGGKDPVLDVAVATDGEWIVIRPDRFQRSTGVSDALASKLARFYREHRQRRDAQTTSIAEYDAREQREQAEREAAARREVERQEAERLAAEKREAERREAERQESLRRQELREREERASRLDSRHLGQLALEVGTLRETIRRQERHLREKRAELYARSDTQFVWRGLREDEDPARGLFARDCTARASIEEAVSDGRRPNQYVHTSLDREIGVYYAAAFNTRSRCRVVQIDLSMVPAAAVVDLSDERMFAAALREERESANSGGKRFAVAHQLVMVRRWVPPEAIMAVHDVAALDVPRGAARRGEVSVLEYKSRLPHAARSAIRQWQLQGAITLFNELYSLSSESSNFRGGSSPLINAAAAAVRRLDGSSIGRRPSKAWTQECMRE
jgi:hypothetical protein